MLENPTTMKALLAVAVVAATLLAATADQTCQKEEASCKDSGAKCVADFVYSAANCTNNTACCKYPLLCVNGVCRTNFEVCHQQHGRERERKGEKKKQATTTLLD